jgi:hypothetical protein
MSALEALRVARAVGVTVTLNDGNLVLEADTEPSQAVLAVLAHNKPAILDLLRSRQHRWTADDWRARFDERAGFLEHDGGLSGIDAKVQAFEHCIVEWLNANPISSPAGRCAWCRKAERSSATIVPFGAGEHHAWLHTECWPAWHQSRRAEAALALRGIVVEGK